MHRLDTAPIDPDQEDTPMNTTPTSPPPLWQLEEADREAAERARVAEWVAGHVDPVTAALARAVAAEERVALVSDYVRHKRSLAATAMDPESREWLTAVCNDLGRILERGAREGVQS